MYYHQTGLGDDGSSRRGALVKSDKSAQLCEMQLWAVADERLKGEPSKRAHKWLRVPTVCGWVQGRLAAEGQPGEGKTRTQGVEQDLCSGHKSECRAGTSGPKCLQTRWVILDSVCNKWAKLEHKAHNL